MNDVDLVVSDPVRLHRFVEYCRERDAQSHVALLRELFQFTQGRTPGPLLNRHVGEFFSSLRVFGVERFEDGGTSFLCAKEDLPILSALVAAHPGKDRIPVWVMTPEWAQLSGSIYAHVAIPDPNCTFKTYTNGVEEVHASPYYDDTWPETYDGPSGSFHSIFYRGGAVANIEACLPDEDTADNAACFFQVAVELVDCVQSGMAGTLMTPQYDGIGLERLLKVVGPEALDTRRFATYEAADLLKFLLHDTRKLSADYWSDMRQSFAELARDPALSDLRPLDVVDFSAADTVMSLPALERAHYFVAAELVRASIVNVTTRHLADLRALLVSANDNTGRLEVRSREELYLPDADLEPAPELEELKAYLARSGARGESESLEHLVAIMDTPWEAEDEQHSGEDLAGMLAERSGATQVDRMQRPAFRPSDMFMAALRRLYKVNLIDYDEEHGGYCKLALGAIDEDANLARVFEIKARSHLHRHAGREDLALARFVRAHRSAASGH